ncbi:MAG: type II toxin-antitoxin system HicB family antitoxin [Bryobacterales bacterium]|nr:type II toxin-antitoxin system HicB family antitoxin [Bryobacterales bacterium]MBV9401424.1 type II toxin-antitoxin system HicB family antitoxin [Bryobacterales bacterium]
MYRYPVTLTRDDNGTILATFPDVPEAVTFGDTREDALKRAAQALEAALKIYIDDQRAVPPPRATRRRGPSVVLPALIAAKVALYQAMRSGGVSVAELGKRVRRPHAYINRLLDLNATSPLDQIEGALSALGKQIDLVIRDAA